MVITLPPGEMQPLSCEGCQGTTFKFFQEVRDGQVGAFHSLCVACGKRGCLHTEITTKVSRSFQQFADPPPTTGPSFLAVQYPPSKKVAGP
jgi:hypothetical protein